MRALEAGSLETVCIYEAADFMRMKLKNKDTDSITVVYCSESDQKNPKYYKEGIHELELIESLPLNEWVAENYK